MFRLKCVNVILRITADCGKSEFMIETDKNLSLMSIMEKVERKNRVAQNYPMWLEAQLCKESISGTNSDSDLCPHDHVDYEFNRLTRSFGLLI